MSNNVSMLIANIRFFLLFVLSISLNFSAALAAHHEDQAYRFAVFPFISASRLEAVFAPVAAHLSHSLGRPVLYQSSKSFDSFKQLLLEGKPDIAFIQPFDYALIAKQQGYVPLVGSQRLLSVILTHQDSDLIDLKQLRGKRLGLPPQGAAISILAKATLGDIGLSSQDVDLRHFKNHSACMQQLLTRRVDACATAPGPRRVYEGKMHVQFKQLAQTKTIPASLFVVNSRISEQQRDLIRADLLALRESSKPGVYYNYSEGTLLVEAFDSDYDGLLEMVGKAEGKKQ